MPPSRTGPLINPRRKSGGLVPPSVSGSSSPAPQPVPSPAYKNECEILKIPKLHQMQKMVIETLVREPKEDMFVIAATGSGKSILYELPAILPQAAGKVTVVFIPRVSIIRIEYERLVSCGVKVEARYKKTGPTAAAELIAQNKLLSNGIVNPSILPSMLLITPHQLEHIGTALQDILTGLSERGLIDRFVFDEVHMLLDKIELIQGLASLRSKFPEIPATVLSASLSPATAEDLRVILKLNRAPKIFPLDRPNLYYTICAKYSSGDRTKNKDDTPDKKELSQLMVIVNLAKKQYPGGAGLVYCRTKDTCRRMARLLTLENVPSEPYDSERGDTDEGIAIFKRWIQNDPSVRVLVSTNALSSGVHKPDVRFVVHTSIPTTGMDGYMQETGRAGRDGFQSTCLLLYAFDDAFKVGHDTAYQADGIYALLRLINNSSCRRQVLLSYYRDNNFTTAPRQIGARCCDICNNRLNWQTRRRDLDVTPAARRLLQYYERQHEKVGMRFLANQAQKRFGSKATNVETWKKLIQILIIERYLEKDRPGQKGGGQVVLVRGPRTNNILQDGGTKVWLPWSMRFKEHTLAEQDDDKDLSLLWTEKIVAGLTEIDVDQDEDMDDGSSDL